MFWSDRVHSSPTAPGAASVSVIDTATNKVTDTITGFNGPSEVAVSPDGKSAYVTSGGFGAGTVSVIDTATSAVTLAPINVSGAPLGVAVSPDGNHAYTANWPNTVSVIDIATT